LEERDDLYVEVPLTIWEATLGMEIEVPRSMADEGGCPPGIQPGDQLRFPVEESHSFKGRSGDQVLTFKMIVPGRWMIGLERY